MSAVESLEGLIELEPDWRRLLSRYRAPTLFMTHHWACAWWECFGKVSQLFVLVVRRHGNIIGIAPLARTFRSIHGVRLREIGFFHNRHTLRGDFLLPEDQEACLRMILQSLCAVGESWDCLYLGNVPEASPIFSSLKDLVRTYGLPDFDWKPGRRHCVLPMTGTWDDYYARLSSNKRKNLRWIRNCLERCASHRFTAIRDRDGLRAALPELFELEKRSWQGADAEAAMREDDRLFLQRLVELTPSPDIGQLQLLHIDGRLAAAALALRLQDVCYDLLTFHDPLFRDVSPGALVHRALLESLWLDGATAMFDWNGDSEFISSWAAKPRQHWAARVYSTNRYARFVRSSRDLISRSARLVSAWHGAH